MTRVVVQRGQGASSSTLSRASNSSGSTAPTPPPLPPHLPVSTLARTSSSSPPPSVKSDEESQDIDPLQYNEPSTSTFDITLKIPVGYGSEGKLTGSFKTEDEECSGHYAAVDSEARQMYMKSRHSVIGHAEEDKPDISEVGSSSAVSSVEAVPFGFQVELPRKQHESQQREDTGLQKTLSDVQREVVTEVEEENLLPPFQNNAEDALHIYQSSHPPLMSQGLCGQPSTSISQGEVCPKVAEVPAGTSVPPPVPASGPPPLRRSVWTGSSLSGGFRSGGNLRKNSRSVRASRSPPHHSRSSSPRSFTEGDGYNSADEQNPWAVGQTVYENNDDRERQFEVEIRRARGLEVRRMAEDGNCLFRAVADQVYGDPEMHSETRQMCIDYMENERDHFSQFVTESFSAYCKRKRRDKVYGNNLEIQAMAEMYNRPIHIFCYSIEPKNIFQGSYQTDLPPIRLSYHRDNHYNSLVDPNRSTVGAGLGFGSLHGGNIDRDQVKAAIKAQQDSQIDKALLAEGRYYSDLELTEQEMERMVIEASRAEFLAEEYGQQIGCIESSTSTAGTSNSQTDIANDQSQLDARHGGGAASTGHTPSPTTNTSLTTNMRMLLSMGFSYFRVVEACSIFGDDINDMLCYLLEAENGGLFEESLYRRKGKAAER